MSEGNSSDEEIKKMTAKTKQYMKQHIAKGTPVQPRFRTQRPQQAGANRNQLIPPNYTCHRCHQKGHLIQNCPTNSNPEFDLKKTPKGMPKNLKKENLPEQVEDKFIKSMVNNEITYIDSSNGMMPEFQCTICKELFNNPTQVPCCNINYCWDCIQGLEQVENHFKCPNCNEQIITIKNITPNILMDRLTQLYKREWIMKRFVKEVEEKEKVSTQEVPDLPQDFDEKMAKYQNMDAEQILQAYETDEEDIKILEETLGLNNNLEQDNKDKEAPSINRTTPIKAPMPNIPKPNSKITPSRMGMSGVNMMPGVNMMSGGMMKRPPKGMMQPSQQMMAPGRMPLMFGYMPSNMPMYPGYMINPDSVKMKGSKKGGDSKRDKDKMRKKRRDKKHDRKNS